jgi:hypothetical protein
MNACRYLRFQHSNHKTALLTLSQRQLAGGGSLAAFIKEKGWDAFRQEEVRVLHGILSGNNAQPTCSNDVDGIDPEQQQQRIACPVVSTGGGVVETLEVIDCQRCKWLLYDMHPSIPGSQFA